MTAAVVVVGFIALAKLAIENIEVVLLEVIAVVVTGLDVAEDFGKAVWFIDAIVVLVIEGFVILTVEGLGVGDKLVVATLVVATFVVSFVVNVAFAVAVILLVTLVLGAVVVVLLSAKSDDFGVVVTSFTEKEAFSDFVEMEGDSFSVRDLT